MILLMDLLKTYILNKFRWQKSVQNFPNTQSVNEKYCDDTDNQQIISIYGKYKNRV